MPTSNFTNIGNITISNIKLNQNICIENSDLGKTTFIDCNFSEQKMIFDSSKITEVALAGGYLPKPSNIYCLAENQDEQKKLALSQIKKIYQNMGDVVTASRYQAEELNTYMNTLSFGWEKLNLTLNKITNNHGQSWGKAFKILLVGGIILYCLYCFSLGFTIDFSKQGFEKLFRNSGYFLEFLNPIRKSDFLPKVLIDAKEETDVPTIAFVVDSISKIFTAYLIYQLIAAFRKHGKKSE